MKSICTFVLAFAFFAVPLFAVERAALVITNSAYPGDPKREPQPGEKLQLVRLEGVKFDGPTMEAALKAVGFTVEVAANLTTEKLKARMIAFAEKYAGSREVVFYFSGHGMAVAGETYLAGIDTEVDISAAITAAKARFTGRELERRLEQLRFDAATAEKGGAVPLTLILANLEQMTPQILPREEAKKHVRIVFLDACREQFPEPEGGSVVGKTFAVAKSAGLDAPPAKPGMFIGFGAQAGRVSFAMEEQPSIFTAALAKCIRKPGNIVDVFRDVRATVADSVDELKKKQPSLAGFEQVPAYTDELNAKVSFSFTPGVLTPVNPTRPKTIAERIAAATNDAPFTNSLGLEFVPVPGTEVLACRTETTRGAFRQFIREKKHDMSGGMYVLKIEPDGKDYNWKEDRNASWENPGFAQTDEHPVVGVSYLDAKAFAAWLSEKEGVTYRLPTDAEWSKMVGTTKYPWGSSDVPPGGAGNYAGEESKAGMPATWEFIKGYRDGEKRTAPVGQFTANRLGIHDLGGNVWEFCEDEYKASMNSAEALETIPVLKNEKYSDGTPFRVLRGASWFICDSVYLRSTCRNFEHPAFRSDFSGFRLVVSVR